MSEMDFETRMRSIAQRMNYPHTPDISGRVMSRIVPMTKPRFFSRRFAWSLTLIVVLLFSLMLIPPVRAAVIEFIQIGIVRIFPRPPETPIDTIQTATPESIVPFTAVPKATDDLLPLLDQLAGETTLAEAQAQVKYQILLPTYPPDLGAPDLVFVQNADGAMTVLIWLDPNNSERVLMSLHFIPEGSWAIDKGFPVDVWETQVNDQPAYWGEGPYPLRLYNGDLEFVRLIEGHVLIWAVDDVTYRLETDLPLLEAIKIAESLQPIP